MEFDSLTYNLLTVWEKVSHAELQDGLTWYARAKATCDAYAAGFAIDPERVYNLCAVLSPQTNWDVNIRMVGEYLQFGHVPGIPAARLAMARMAYDGVPLAEITKGKKVLAFAESIRLAGTGNNPCIDSHAVNAAVLGKTPERVRKAIWASTRLHSAFAESCREAAERCGVPVQQFQAVIWVAWRSRLQYDDFSRPTLFSEVE